MFMQPVCKHMLLTELCKIYFSLFWQKDVNAQCIVDVNASVSVSVPLSFYVN